MIKLIFFFFSSLSFALQLEVKLNNSFFPFDLTEEMDYKVKGFLISEKSWVLEISRNTMNFPLSNQFAEVLTEALKVKKFLRYDPFISSENIKDILIQRKGNCISFVSYLNEKLKNFGYLTKEVHGILFSKEKNGPFYLSNLSATPHRWIKVFFKDFGWVSFDPLSENGRISNFHLPLKDKKYLKSLKDLEIKVLKWD